ncbi:uncharacterized protein NPIL_400491 [Nephila pilipes]|uniref:Tc1-like transposase DDE domain-containing protein n=1 Tax=Nephila pilipes TaxID=299642 RepID=A0A8X6P653_NEPPI|nr:uncharacterized protein NPIL_400491 [Nephila pilipes]
MSIYTIPKSILIVKTFSKATKTLLLSQEPLKKNLKCINWPPYSPDFNPCDWFLRGKFKDKVCSQNPKTVPELKCAIQRQIEAIDACNMTFWHFDIYPTLESVIRHFVLRMHHAIARDGRHIELEIS